MCDVKRLTRPRFNHEFTQFNDRSAFSKHNGEPETCQDTDLLGLVDDSKEEKKSIEILDIEDSYDPAME